VQRKERKVPIIEQGWILQEKDSSHEYWSKSDRSVYSLDPIHLYKVVLLEAGKSVGERDAFHFEGNDSIAYRLIMTSEVVNDSLVMDSRARFITYFKDKIPPTRSDTVSIEFADSVLSRWKLQE
jgi:hypothetical protein